MYHLVLVILYHFHQILVYYYYYNHHHYHHRHIAWFSYLHNYGPGPYAGTYAYYDGPTSVRCKQSAAAYRGQDGQRHPCF